MNISSERKSLFPLVGCCVLLLLICSFKTEAKCRRGCELAMASYYVLEGSNLTYISSIFGRQIPDILRYNPHVPNQDSIGANTRINVPFSCECLNGDFLGHTFAYVTQIGDTYDKIAKNAFANLTNEYWVQRVNMYDPTRIPDFVPINVTVNCSCGDRHVSRDYGLFATYPLRLGESLSSVATEVGVTEELLRRFNAESDFGAGTGLVFVPAKVLSTSIPEIRSYNPTVTSQDLIVAGTRLNVPFSCGCIEGEFPGHQFDYEVVSGDYYGVIAGTYYANLTTVGMLEKYNSYDPNRLPDVNTQLNVTVNCSCGNSRVSKDYGLFITYPLRPGENLSSIATDNGVTEQLLRDYNPASDFSSGSGLVFVPGKDQNGTFPSLKSRSSGISGGAIAGLSVGGVTGALFLAGCFYVGFYRRKKVEGSLLRTAIDDDANALVHGPESPLEKTSKSGPLVGVASSRLAGITVDKSVEFSYEELAKATDDFNLSNKIGQGGFGAVYYAELRGEKAAIKKMDMQASKEFLAELKVRLIGYCVEGSLFLVYEFIENGNLSQHLRASGREPLPWSTRVQIALDSARGLEYIHEHTVPVYIHRDIKPANILIDKNFRAKVADFGLTKLTEVGSASLQTRLVGTFGYMPPEYAQYGDVSPKIDVYAFGVVLFELISAKEAIVKTNEVVKESRGLVGLFEEVLSQPDPEKDLCKLVDPNLGDDYPLDSVRKIAQLAKACTHENPQLRPSMRSIVVALMTLSSSTEDWDVGSFYENQGLVSLMSGRSNITSSFQLHRTNLSLLEDDPKKVITACTDGPNVQPIDEALGLINSRSGHSHLKPAKTRFIRKTRPSFYQKAWVALGDLGRKKLVVEGSSVEEEGTADSYVKDGNGDHLPKHNHGVTQLGDASSRHSRIKPARLPFTKRVQLLFTGSIPVNSGGSSLDVDSTLKSLQYSFHTISVATGNFCDSSRLGMGGFGPVHKGILPNGQQIAVKRLFGDSVQGELEFKSEVALLAKLQHRNLGGQELMILQNPLPGFPINVSVLLAIAKACTRENPKLRPGMRSGDITGNIDIHDKVGATAIET
ncbi:hypothetical protein RJ639_046140 [Escallonia herrerae]|uniref:Protein kinase domain-containing protein n=1 Tax=Escallonia herrerae TaxID=1293975 RepID=A0AA88W6C7_9ASTE|nr:hypothetical protein RJ639_046140 [Escallonia herrerae]